MKKFLLALLFAACGATPAAAAVGAVSYTDLWWNPAEPGWGLTIDQQQTTLFLTFYVYGSDGAPTWVVAQLAQTGTSPGGLPVFSGGVSATTGPWYGGSYATPGVRTAGTATFTPTDAVSGRLDYTIDGVAVSKPIQRQTLVNENLSGSYTVVGDLTLYCPGLGSDHAPMTTAATLTHTGTAFVYRQSNPEDPASTCTMTGTSVQEGQLARASGVMSCSDGTSGTLSFTEVATTSSGFVAKMRIEATIQGYRCTLSGPVAGMKE